MDSSIINIGIVGGGLFCKEVLEKMIRDYRKEEVNARFCAVAASDPQSPGILYAKKRGLKTFDDYHKLYDPSLDINLIIILTPEREILEDILATKPSHIRILSYQVFEIVWKVIGLEERKLRERTEEIETILNGIQDIISVINPDFTITEVNEAFLKKMRKSRDEIIGKKCYEIFQNFNHPCDEEKILCPLKRVIQNKDKVNQIITRLDSKGQTRYFEVNIYPIWERDGKISKFIDISRDITKKLKEEEEMTRRLEQMVEERTRQLKETHNKLLHQDKMASLGKLAASVVHEINNPIAGILNLILLIKRIFEEDKLGKNTRSHIIKYLDLMETETRRISQIVSSLLAFSRQSKMELHELDLNQLIEQTLFLNSNLFKISKVKIEKRLDKNLPKIMGSADQLQQVFMNIISNAVEAMEHKNGSVLKIETACEDDKLVVIFEDTGVGIPEENLSKIFEPFFTTKKNGKGVGLGLSVAYGIIQEHGGSIDVKSIPGKGSVLKIKLPLKGVQNKDYGYR